MVTPEYIEEDLLRLGQHVLEATCRTNRTLSIGREAFHEMKVRLERSDGITKIDRLRRSIQANVINNVILSADLDETTRARALRAFSKLLWIQNDLITRHDQAA